jgi:hypothetical protein
VDAHAADLAARNLQVSVTEGPRDRDKRAVWIDIDAPTRLVQLVVWASGEAVLSVADIVTGEVLNEELELTGEFGLRQALGAAVAWAEGGGRYIRCSRAATRRTPPAARTTRAPTPDRARLPTGVCRCRIRRYD